MARTTNNGNIPADSRALQLVDFSMGAALPHIRFGTQCFRSAVVRVLAGSSSSKIWAYLPGSSPRP